jgi:hypothetical protein
LSQDEGASLAIDRAALINRVQYATRKVAGIPVARAAGYRNDDNDVNDKSAIPQWRRKPISF